MTLDNLPHDIYLAILSEEDLDISDIIALRQTCQRLRTSIKSILECHPAIYREKLTALAKIIPTGLPPDLSTFATEQLEIAALSAYAVEKKWRLDSPGFSGPPMSFYAGADIPFCAGAYALPVVPVEALKVSTNGRWIIALCMNRLSVFDAVEGRIVSQRSCGNRVYEYETQLETNANGHCMVAVAAHRHERYTLDVYSLELDPTTTLRDDNLIVLIGCVSTRSSSESIVMKEPLVCAINHEGIVIYDWQRHSGRIVNLEGWPELFPDNMYNPLLLPEEILLVRDEPPLSLYFVEIPELLQLDHTISKEVAQRPAESFMVPKLMNNHNDPESILDEDLHYTLTVINHLKTSSPSSSLSLISLTMDEGQDSRISLNLTKVDCQSHTASFASGRQTSRLFPIMKCFECHTRQMSLGVTGKRAIWLVEQDDKQHLLGVTVTGREVNQRGKDSLSGLEDITTPDNGQGVSDRRTVVPQGHCLKPQSFTGSSPLRYLPLVDCGSISTIGFDESTATVALGNYQGQVWILKYGLQDVVR